MFCSASPFKRILKNKLLKRRRAVSKSEARVNLERAEISTHTQEEGMGRRGEGWGRGRRERMGWRDVEVLLLVPHIAQISTGGL